MARQSQSSISQLLERVQADDVEAREVLYRVLFEDLRSRASSYMKSQPSAHTLQASALVNEAFLRLARPRAEAFQGRAHFMASASRAMRHVLVDHARRRRQRRRAPEPLEVPLDQLVETFEESACDLEALEVALGELEQRDPVMAEAVQLRFFGGLPMPEVARMLELSLRTFERRWQATRAWLRARAE